MFHRVMLLIKSSITWRATSTANQYTIHAKDSPKAHNSLDLNYHTLYLKCQKWDRRWVQSLKTSTNYLNWQKYTNKCC